MADHGGIIAPENVAVGDTWTHPDDTEGKYKLLWSARTCTGWRAYGLKGCGKDFEKWGLARSYPEYDGERLPGLCPDCQHEAERAGKFALDVERPTDTTPELPLEPPARPHDRDD